MKRFEALARFNQDKAKLAQQAEAGRETVEGGGVDDCAAVGEGGGVRQL
jgi:hypothetical protein